MLLSWGFLLPSGVIAAHFLRHRGPVWFKIHRAVQVTGLVLATIGWAIALARFDVFGRGFNPSSLHGGLGMTVMVLGLLQPINAFFRPHPEPKTRARDIWGASMPSFFVRSLCVLRQTGTPTHFYLSCLCFFLSFVQSTFTRKVVIRL